MRMCYTLSMETKTTKKPISLPKINFVALKSLKAELGKNKLLLGALSVILFAGVAYFVKGWFVAAIVNGKPITRFAVIKQLEEAQGNASLESLITQSLVEQAAAKQKVNITKEDVTKEISSIEDSLKAQNQNLDEVLDAQGMTRTQLNEQIRYKALVEKLLGDKLNVTDDEITKYIADNKDSLPTEDETQVKDIVVQQLKQQKLADEYQNLIADLKDKAHITYFIKY